MKAIFFLSMLLLNLFSLKAEYNGFFIKFIIEKTDGKKIEGHMFAVHFEPDSIKNFSYLRKELDASDHDYDSSITFYKNRIKYEYQPYNDEKRRSIYSLINEQKIKTDKIKKISILEVISSSYLSGIANKLSLKDTTWMKTKPIKTVVAAGYLCDYQLYFHETNSELDKLIKELKEAAKQEDDEILVPIIEKIIKFKVLVIGTCTC